MTWVIVRKVNKDFKGPEPIGEIMSAVIEEKIPKNLVELRAAEELAEWKARRAELDAKIAEREAVKALSDAKPKEIRHWTVDSVANAQDRALSPSEKLMYQRAPEPTKPSASANDRGWNEDFFVDLRRQRIIQRLAAGDYKDPSHRDLDVERLEQIRTTTGR
jgi:hypothetical protein